MAYSTIDLAKQIEGLLSLSELCGTEETRAREVKERLLSREITVSVIGQFKRGKSTLVNAMLGEELLPVGIVPVTSAVTQIRYGSPAAEIHFENGGIVPAEITELPDYINEQKNKDNKLGVSSVVIHTPAELLKDGMILVDTPGVGSVHQHNSEAAYAFVKESDAVIFMLSVDSPINQIEIDFLRDAKEFAAKFYFAVNKTDTVEADELEVYLDYCRRLLCGLMDVEQVQMFPVSARSGRGVPELAKRIQEDCAASMQEIVEASARRKLDDIIGAAVSRLNLYWSILQLTESGFEEKFVGLQRDLAEVRAQGAETAENTLAEAEKMAQAVQIGYENGFAADRKRLETDCLKLKNSLELKKNETKRRLSDIVGNRFGMNYHYDIEELNLKSGEPGGKNGETGAAAEAAELSPQQYRQEISERAETLGRQFVQDLDELCSELSLSLNKILLYKEKNAYTVARRLEDLNQLTRKLKRLREQL